MAETTKLESGTYSLGNRSVHLNVHKSADNPFRENYEHILGFMEPVIDLDYFGAENTTLDIGNIVLKENSEDKVRALLQVQNCEAIRDKHNKDELKEYIKESCKLKAMKPKKRKIRRRKRLTLRKYMTKRKRLTKKDVADAKKKKALEDGKRLKVCLERIKIPGPSSNINLNVANESKTFETNNIKSTTEDNKQEIDKLFIYSSSNPEISKVTFNRSNLNINDSNVKVYNIPKIEDGIEIVKTDDACAISEIDVLSGNPLTNSSNNIDNQVEDISFNVIKREDLSSSENTSRIKKLPIVIKENVLPRNMVKINVKKSNENNNNTISPDNGMRNDETNVSQIIADINVHEVLLIDNEEASNIENSFSIDQCIGNLLYHLNDVIANDNPTQLFNMESCNLLENNLNEINSLLDLPYNGYSNDEIFLHSSSRINNYVSDSNSCRVNPSSDISIADESTIAMLNSINSTEYNNELKRKPVSEVDNMTEGKPKKTKLNKSHWQENCNSQLNNDNEINSCDKLIEVVQNKTTENGPSIKETNVATVDTNIATEIENVKVANDSNVESTTVSIQQEHVPEPFGSINYKRESNSLQSTQNSNNLTLKTVRTQNYFSDNDKSRNWLAQEEEEDDDYISLFADSTLMDDCVKDISLPETSPKSVRTETPCGMADSAPDNFCKSTISEFNKVYTTSIANESKNTKHVLKEQQPVTKFVPSKNIMKDVERNGQIGVTLNKNKCDIYATAIKNFCFRLLKYGKCGNRRCNFDHKILPRLYELYCSNEQHLYVVLQQMVSNRNMIFIRNTYSQLISQCKDVAFVLKVLKKWFELKVLSNKNIADGILKMLKNEIPVKTIVKHLTDIVNEDDFEFVKFALVHVDDHIPRGQYWHTLTNLLLRVKKVESVTSNNVAPECIGRRTRRKVQNMIKQAKSKYEECKLHITIPQPGSNQPRKVENKKQVAPEVAESIRNIDSLKSPDQNQETYVPKLESLKNSQLQTDDNNNNTENGNSSFVVHLIDDLPKSYSVHGRKKFWKFYLELNSLQEGLKHNDYKHVLEILNKASSDSKSLFTRACYTILLKELQYSQVHLKKIISLAVQSGATAAFYEIITDVAIHILTVLADKELWVLALTLLKHVILRVRASVHDFDAATLMLFVQIYLANQRPLKAFDLLKQSNIICTRRDDWTVENSEKDDRARTQILPLLLDTLCQVSQEHAYFLFTFLIADQTSNFHPIDLPVIANKLISALLLQDDLQYEIIASIGRDIENHNIVLNTDTYRALIATLVNVDLELAKRLYQIAISLGIYSRIRFFPTTYVIVHSDWTREEMYLTILSLIQELLLNVGHAIDRINSKHLAVYLIFESIPSETQLVFDDGYNEQCENKLRAIRLSMKDIMQTRFDPPISFVKACQGKMVKLNTKSLLTHLKSRHQ